MKYTSINIQGNLISEDILQKIEAADAQGQLAKDFGFEPGINLRSEIEYAWSRVKLDWKHFTERSEKLPSSDPYGTTITRRWMTGFFSTLGFDLTLQKSSLTGDNEKSYNISHTCQALDGLPVHITGFFDPNHPEKNTLDIRSSGGTSRLSPHATIQEYLNVTEHLYALVTNGLMLRLVRDSGRLVKLTYIEFDLKRLLDEDKYSEFTLLYRLLHASRFPKSKQETEVSFLEKYYQDSIESGNRIRDGLSDAVKSSLLALGNGFLQHESNTELGLKLISGKLAVKDFNRQLLRLIYRMLFLMVTEERDLIYDPEDKTKEKLALKRIYLKYYSISRLRQLSRKPYLHEKQYTDLWQGLIQTFRLFEEGSKGHKLGIMPLAGDLFSRHAIKDVESCLISNHLLLTCVKNLSEFYDDNNNLVTINYRSLDVEELGSVYEGLLELHPFIENLIISNDYPGNLRHPEIKFTFHEGTERKTTGSYYTRPELVNELIKSALIPVIEERLKLHTGNKEAQANALLSLKVCDPAAGSGHMLLAAARTIGWYLARVRTGEDNPSPGVYRVCLREAIQHCIYAVDMNPDAVELCKLSLWLESHNSCKPLSFLDHKIKCGNSLVGITDLTVVKKGIPNEAYNPVTGDYKEVCRAIKRDNQRFLIFLSGKKDVGFQKSFEFDTVKEPVSFSGDYHELDNIQQDNLEGVNTLRKKYEQLRSNTQWYNEWTACNIWTSAFFYTYTPETLQGAPTSEQLNKYMKSPSSALGTMVGKANGLAMENKFFHWPLEFPDVFEVNKKDEDKNAETGFDVMLGNPPWERIKLQQQEFFATRDISIADAANSTARNHMIELLSINNPELYSEYNKALHKTDSTGKFLRDSERYKFTAIGDINTYSVFSEVYYRLMSKSGRSGFIVPTGIATDDSNKIFFSELLAHSRLVSLFDFENKEAVFPQVHRSYKFCLLTLAGTNLAETAPRFGFFLTRVEHLQDKLRIFNLSIEDFLRLNPNTKTCPVFRTSMDAILTAKIYKRVPVLINEISGENPWGVKLATMFHMSNDSHLFRTREQLESEGFGLWGNRMRRGKEIWLPLYEAKMIWHYDHRFGSYAGVDNRTSTQMPTPKLEQYQDPGYQIIPWYWVEETSVLDQLVKTDSDNNIIWQWKHKWLLGFRDITNSTNERTAILTIEPLNAVGNNNPLIFHDFASLGSLLFQANFSSIVFDFPTRFKIAGTHMNFFYVNQLPVLAPSAYPKAFLLDIYFRSIELVYSCWDIKPFIDDIWKESDDLLKSAIKNQWQENKSVTGGHEWNPPEWCEIDPKGCPLPPFKWNEDRRAVLKAELDAIYAKLYGLTTEELRYILDPQDVYGPDFPGETFRVLKEKEIRKYGEYRTKRLVLEAWERLEKEK